MESLRESKSVIALEQSIKKFGGHYSSAGEGDCGPQTKKIRQAREPGALLLRNQAVVSSFPGEWSRILPRVFTRTPCLCH